MKKALLVTTVCGFIPQFEMNNVKILKEMGYEIHYASNFDNPVYYFPIDIFENFGIVKHQVDFVRSPYSFKNIKAYKQLKRVLYDEKFKLIHCHTPMGSVITRYAARKLVEKGTKMIYTAHGFHFYKGAPTHNWLFYYPIEYKLAKWTDVLITINSEDYKNASTFKLHQNGKLYKVNGVGIKDIPGLKQAINNTMLSSHRSNDGDFNIISVGELTKRKNQMIVIKALEQLNDPKIKYFICGSGEKESEIQEYIRNRDLTNQVFLLGYRKDVKSLLKKSDCFVHSSLQEGLSMAVMEAMACGVPVICSDIRGNNDLITNGWEGFLVKDNDVAQYASCIKKLKEDKELCKWFSDNAMKKIQQYSITVVEKQMRGIYENLHNL